MLKLKKSLFFTLFLVFFGRPAAFGYFPDSVNGGFIEKIGFPGYEFRFNFGIFKPHNSGVGGNTQFFSYFTGGQSFHIIVSDTTIKNIKNQVKYVTKLLTKPRNIYYNVSMYRQISSYIGDSLSNIAKYRQSRGDKNMENFDEELTLEALEKELKKIQRDILRYQEWMRDTARMVQVALVRQSVIKGFYEERKQGVQSG